MRISVSRLLGLALLCPSLVPAENLRQVVQAYTGANQREILSGLMAALTIPAVAADEVNIRRKADLLRGELAARQMVS